ncbi:hypothetical protein [Chryseobacterium sp. IT-36CA2]
MQEALDFANEGLVKATVTSVKSEDINDVFDKIKKGQIDGRIILDIAGSN